MANVPLTMAVEHYDRHIPFFDGSVVPEGVALTVYDVGQSKPGRHGEQRHERALAGEWDVAELSLSSYLMARDRGLQVEERKVSVDEWKDGVASGEIAEVFACGTAAVVTPIGELKGDGFAVGDIDAPAGEVTMAIRKELTDIQYGRAPDRHGWLVRLR